MLCGLLIPFQAIGTCAGMCINLPMMKQALEAKHRIAVTEVLWITSEQGYCRSEGSGFSVVRQIRRRWFRFIMIPSHFYLTISSPVQINHRKTFLMDLAQTYQIWQWIHCCLALRDTKLDYLCLGARVGGKSNQITAFCWRVFKTHPCAK